MRVLWKRNDETKGVIELSMTYADAVEWAIDNVPIDFYDSFDEWLNASKSELQTPELTNNPTFTKQMEQAWENQVGDIKKTKQQLEQEEIEQRRIDEIQTEPEVREPTAEEVQHELERNLPPEQQSKDFITKEKTGALSNVLSSLPKGTKISIPQPKGAPIEIKPSVTFPKGITMTRPPITSTIPQVVRPVPVTFRQTLATTARAITGGFKKGLSAIGKVFRI